MGSVHCKLCCFHNCYLLRIVLFNFTSKSNGIPSMWFVLKFNYASLAIWICLRHSNSSFFSLNILAYLWLQLFQEPSTVAQIDLG
jgi:hypothetical protein